MNDINDRYLNDDYVNNNPTWDSEDSPWKAEQVHSILSSEGVIPESVCEVGCGAGKVLESLAVLYPDVSFSGYDIAPAAETFWEKVQGKNIRFTVGDFLIEDDKHYDLLLLLDVLEHVADPHGFLVRLRPRSDYLVVHFPLDLSAFSVVREKPLLYVRRKVGHIHYFTKGLALALLDECGFDVIDCQYTGAAFNTPQAGWKTRLAQLPRRIAYALNKDVGVRLMGGETLMALVKAR